MFRGHWFFWLVFAGLILPTRLAFADPAATQAQSFVPVVQLTVQPPRFLLTRDNCVGNALLRELQRQAVLIAARDELGLGTRDMVLREPFAVHNTNSATTVLIETRIWRGDQAQICLARFDGKQPADPYALADLQVDRPENTCQKWIDFKIGKEQLVDYPVFVAKCELASRTSCIDALKTEKVLGDFSPKPVAWAATGPASPGAMDRLRHLDVFSQYLAIRLLHGQIAADGASPERMSALVRAYANLGQLTTGQWSMASKVFFARALLYAERLVVHENRSSDSLQVRAYARALAGLHAAALDDLQNADAPAPPWAAMAAALCRYDSSDIERLIAMSQWQDRMLGTFLAADIAMDDFPQAVQQDAISRGLNQYPSMFVLAPFSNGSADNTTPRPADRVVDQLPVVLSETLKDAALPSSVLYAVKHVVPGDDSYRQIAMVRDRLYTAASKSPLETTEPSLAVLGDLIEQQEMLALVNRLRTLRTHGNIATELPKLLTGAQGIINRHLWGPYAEAMAIDGNSNPARMQQTLARIKDRLPGSWVSDSITDLNLNEGDELKMAQSWQTIANLSADTLVDDYTQDSAAAKAVNHNLENYLWQLLKSSPHSAMLTAAWLTAMPEQRIRKDKSLYDKTLDRVEHEFSDRPPVLESACDWCDDRGDFPRSLSLLVKIDRIEPAGGVCERMAKTLHRLDRDSEAIATLMRGVSLLGDADEVDPATLYQVAACYCIDDHRFTDALACIQLSDASPTPRVWQLMARCYEAMGKLEDAEQCMRQQATNSPEDMVDYYLWAKRLGRKDTAGVRQKALAAIGPHNDSIFPSVCMSLAEDQEHKALELLRSFPDALGDAFGSAQLLILATKHSDKDLAKHAAESLSDPFGLALKSLASAKDIGTAAREFDEWVHRQLDDENAVDWYSLAGRYLLAAGHVEQGKTFLIKAIRCSAREQPNYFLAWRELQKLGEDPRQLMSVSTSQP